MQRLAIFCALVFVFSTVADDHEKLKVGRQSDGRIVVPTNQILHPAGKQIEFAGRPVDLMMIDGDRILVVKSRHEILFIDVGSGAIKQKLTTAFEGKKAVGLSITGLAKKQGRIYVSDGTSKVMVANKNSSGDFAWEKAFAIPEAADKKGCQPAGICVVGDDHLAVTATRNNSVYILDREKGDVLETVKVGVAPFTVLPVGDSLYVSNWGGDHPKEGEPQAKSSGTPTKIDPKSGIANTGSVSVLKRKSGKWAAEKSIPCGPHSSGMCASKSGRFVYVANAAADTVSVIDAKSESVVETIPCRPEGRLPFGSGSNAVTLSPDGATLYVANGTNNCVAVVALGSKSTEAAAKQPDSKMIGQIPVGWYPGAIIASADGKRIYVANIKGVGALSQPRKADKGMNSHDHLGTVSLIDLPDAAELTKLTERVNQNNRLAYSLAGLEKPRPGAEPVPVPERHGEPSLIEHVVYIIKENRTYDQVFGDIKEGNGEPKLCIFGQEITPNHHALARQFVLLDNFYCSGVLSADGHSWVNEAYVTDYLERSFGAFTRSYPDHGQDPLAYPLSGFLWDNALSKNKTVYNYGEFVNTEYEPKTAKWVDGFQDYEHKTNTIKLKSTPNVPGLKDRTHPAYPWFPLLIPDVYRARIFLEDLKEYEKKGSFPNLVYITLPADHTQGTSPDFPTPRAMVADNDLALGQIVQGLSRSKFWPKMAIFVVEDDPQNGYDHVDGHRTVALCISPYTKRKSVDSTCYNQTGMVKTIELILGLNPMNQLDLAATPMRNCFTNEPNTAPYFLVKNIQRLDEMNKPLAQLTGKARYWARKSLQLNREAGDTDDEDTLNRIIWYSVRGNEPYPGDK